MEMAAALKLPLVLYQVSAGEALVDKIREFREQPSDAAGGSGSNPASGGETRIAVYNFCGTGEELGALMGLGCFVAVNGRAAGA